MIKQYKHIGRNGLHRLAGVTRRDFVRAALVAGVAFGAGRRAWGAAKGEVPRRALGRTGEKVSVIGLGGYHLGTLPDEAAAVRLTRRAIDEGVTFMDNCWDYHEGRSETWMGNALRDGYRDRVFLMSKIDGHTREAAAKQIDESLKRLQTDRVDLMQFHEVIRMDDPEKIFGPGGAMEAMQAARKAGKVRFIGFTGHKDPKIHLHMLEVADQNGFLFDAVQMPLNVMDAHFRSFEKEVLPVLVQKRIGVLGMKPIGSGHLLKSKAATATECLRYALSLPTSTVITGIDKPELLDQALEAAGEAQPMGKAERTDLLARTAPHAEGGKFELFKTTTQFDGTVHNPNWLGTA